MAVLMKGFKVSDATRARTVGIACRSLTELIDKGKTKLKVSGEISLLQL